MNWRLLILFTLVYGTQVNGQVSHFNKAFNIFLQKHQFADAIDYRSISQQEIEELTLKLNGFELSAINSSSDFPSLINAYNFITIKTVIEHYPILSVKDVPQFFTKKNQIGSLYISLNDLEAQIVEFMDSANAHLLLNCAAISCAPIVFIENLSIMDSAISNTYRNPAIVNILVSEKKIYLSKLFYWYKDAFDRSGGILNLLSSQFPNQDLSQYTLEYQEYNWAINDLYSSDYLIYYPTKLFKKGEGELKIFNNYYTQSDNGLRSNFFSSFIQLQVGTNKNYNWGFDMKFRSVNQGDVGIFSALKFENKEYFLSNQSLTFSRFGISAFGPRIKYQPFKNKGNINFLHSIYFVPMENTEGNNQFGYFDFQNVQVFNNVFIEKELSVKRRLFFDIGFHIENIRLGVHRNFNHTMQLQLPITAIYSYFPTPKLTLYALANLALKPIFTYAPNADTTVDLDGYAQLGIGTKYYVTNFLEMELLYTYFADQTPGRFANTFNIGFRFYR